ncbi:MAG: hypothetical protein GY906_12185 [bacterium]|nr:hypothetical protein [bacterium]
MSVWIRGTAADWQDLSDQLVEAATGSSLEGVAVSSGGINYVVGDILTVAGGTSTIAAQVEVTSEAAGVIDGVRVYNGGVYTVNPSSPNSCTGGSGTGCSITLTMADNGWTALRDQMTQVSGVVVADGGTGYDVDDIIDLDGGTFTERAQLRVTGETGNVIDTVSIETAGEYSVLPANDVGQFSVAPAGGSGAEFTLTWAAGEKEVILEGEGGGSDEIYVGWRTFSDVGSDYYNLELHGFTGYNSALPLIEQPGASPGFNEGVDANEETGAYLITTSVSFNYFLNINPYRIIITCAVGATYMHAYLGWGNRFATSAEYPYPMIIAGCAEQHDHNSSLSNKISTLTDPWAIASSSTRGPFLVYAPDGTWTKIQNRRSLNPIDDNVVIPCQRPQGAFTSPSDPRDRFMSLTSSFSDIIWCLSSGSTGTQTANLKPTGDDEHRVLLPAIVVLANPTVQVLMEIDEVFWISTFGGVTNEDRYIDDNGVAYRIFQNCNRSDAFSYLAIKEAD